MADTLLDQGIVLAPKGSTGTGRKSARGFLRAGIIAVEFVVEAAGGTPTITFTIQGMMPGGDPAAGGDWEDIMYLDGDATPAASKAAIVKTAVGREVKYIDGLDKRFFDYIAVNISANTNITYRATAYPIPG